MRPDTKHFIDRAFSGMDVLTPAESLAPGQAVLIDNFLMTPGGKLVSRKGFVGQFTTALSGPIYLARDRYVMPDGTLRLVFACAGKLYHFTPGATSAVEIKKPAAVSFSFTDAANVRFAQWGKYIFLLDAGDTSGAIWRCDLSAGDVATSLSAMTAPTDPPTATTSFEVLNALDPADWGVDTFTNANVNLCSNPRFDGADTSGSNLGNYWKIVAGSPKGYDSGSAAGLPALGTGEKWLRLDDPGDVTALDKNSTAIAAHYLDNGYAENTKWSSSSDLRRWCYRFLFKCRAVQLGAGGKPFHVRLQFFSSAATPTDTSVPLYEHDEEISLSASSKDELVRTVIDVSPHISGSVRYVRLFLLADSASTVGTAGPYVTDVEIKAIHPLWDKPDPALSEAGFIPVSSSISGVTGEDTNVLSGLYLAFNPSGVIDATGLNSLALTLSTRASFTPPPLLQFKFQDTSAGVWTSPPVVYSDAITVDITDMPGSMKPYIDRFAMVFLEDATVSGITTSRTPASTRCAFYINDMVSPGNLSVGVPYSYLFSDFDADGATYLEGGKESSGSPDSKQITLEGAQGRVAVVLPSGFSPVGDNFLIWRRGGVVPNSDTRPRLAAMVSTTANASGDNWSWDYATRTFTDNIPDTQLWFESVYQIGRDAPPTGGRCLIVHAQRLFVGVYDATSKINRVYASWLLDDGSDAGYYFTRSPDPTDPEGEIKGGSLLERGDAGDRIQALVSMKPPAANEVDMLAAHLLVLKETSPPSTLTGSRGGVGVAGAFQLLPASSEKGGGCIAPQSAEYVRGVWWASASGLTTLASNGNFAPTSLAIKTLLSLEDIGPTRYSQVFLLWHDHKAFALLPGAGSTDGLVYVWDERAPQGSRWTRMSAPQGFTSAVTLSGGQDSGQVYFGGRNGQLFLYTGTADKATPSAGNTAIALTLTTRKWGQGEAGAVSFFAAQQAQEIQLEVEAGASLTMNGTLYSDEATRAFSWVFAAGVKTALIRGLGKHEGTTHWVTLTGSATTATAIKAVSLKATETSNRRR